MQITHTNTYSNCIFFHTYLHKAPYACDWAISGALRICGLGGFICKKLERIRATFKAHLSWPNRSKPLLVHLGINGLDLLWVIDCKA